MKNNKFKIFNKLLKYLILSVIFSFFILDIKIFAPQINADAQANFGQIVLEQNSKRVLTGINEDVKLPMASTTKILTAITVIENADLNAEVKIPKEAVGVEGSSIYLREGEVLTVESLLYGLMLRSGNDAAVALAIHVSGGIENFAKLMNATAKKCGANNSNFKNPHGLTDAEHYTTCYDLALITAYAMDNSIFEKICSTKKIKCGDRIFINKNKMLANFDGCNGVKTGYTVNAGRCLVTAAKRDDMQLISVVLNCPDMYERSSVLLNDAFENFQMIKVKEKGSKLCTLSINNGMTLDEAFDLKLSEDIILPLTKQEVKSISFSCDVVDFLNFPVKKGEYVGDLSVFVGKDLIFSLKLVTIEEINEYGIDQILNGIFVRW